MADTPDFIPDNQFTPDPAPAKQAADQGQASNAPDFVPDQEFQPDEQKFNTPGQLGLASAENILGGAVTKTGLALAEKGLSALGVPGLTPEEQAGREANLKAQYPGSAQIGEASGLGLSLFTGVGEGKLLSLAGEGAAAALGLGKAAQEAALIANKVSLGQKIATGAVKAAGEFGLLGLDNEVAKAINGHSGGVGDALGNVGLSALMGLGTGGALSGIGAGLGFTLDAIGLKEMSDRWAYKAAHANEAEAITHELQSLHDTHSQMGSELGGAEGLKARAVENLMPETHQGMVDQAEGWVQEIRNAADRMDAAKDGSGMANEIRAQADRLAQAINPNRDRITLQPQTPITGANIWDAANQVKKQFWDWSAFEKKNPNPQLSRFISNSKAMGSLLKEGLENPEVWGDLGDFQKNLNQAYVDSIDPVKFLRKKFFENTADGWTVNPARVGTYLRENGRSVSPTIRQQVIGSALDGIRSFSKATADAYEKAGVENPHGPIGLSALDQSIQQMSAPAKLADLIYDKLTPEALGLGAGIGIGQAALPGISGVYAGRWVLGPAMTALFRPIIQRIADAGAFGAAYRYSRAVEAGQSKLANAAKALFQAGTRVLPEGHVPDLKRLLKLDDKTKKLQNDTQAMNGVSDGLVHYLPEAAQAHSRAVATAVSYLNTQRPAAFKPGPLDAEIEPSRADEADFHRKLEIAEQPLVCLQRIKDGELLPSDIMTLKSCYPDYYENMSQQIMVGLTDAVHSEAYIPYRTRMGISLFLGQPLDSTLSPQSMVAAQSTFNRNAPQQNPGQSGGSTKKGTSKLGAVASNAQTPEQARMARQNKA